MIRSYLSCLLILVALNLTAQNNQPNILPQPVSMELGEGAFVWNENTTLNFEPGSSGTKPVIQYILDDYRKGFGKERQYGSKWDIDQQVVSFQIDSAVHHPEGYVLSVSGDGILCRAATPAGWFYGWQSLKQLFPLSYFEKDQPVRFPFTVPAMIVNDYPRFEYRGMHLDVCRHFFSIAEVKQYIDLLASYKMNRFHWHLTDDQGWRIEIKKYPKLTEIGAFRKETLIGHYSDQPHRFDGTRYGGFYTQEQIREVVRYAQQRQVTIVPEIEMPGHALAALASYPELACTEGPFDVATKWGVFEDVFCPTERTFDFLRNVLTEVAGLFPGEYIHIGGDEVPKVRWKESAFCQSLMKRAGLATEAELQSYFIQRIETILSGLGKKLIGWDEILEGGLSEGATVMSWRGTEGGIAAAQMGNDVIMTPGSHCYFDHYQSDHPGEPVAIGGFTPLEKVYAWEPVPPALTTQEAVHILGAQANLWTEYILDFAHLQYMAYPRAIALAEVLWSPPATRNEQRFNHALQAHFALLDARKINYARHLLDVGISSRVDREGVLLVSLNKRIPGGEIRYTTDGSEPVSDSYLYSAEIPLNGNAQIQAALFLPDGSRGRTTGQHYRFHIGLGAKVELRDLPSEAYNTGGTGALLNGVNGQDRRYGDAEWLGFSGKNVDALIELKEEQEISSFSTRFYHGPGQWIYAPVRVSLYAGKDPQRLELIRELPYDAGNGYWAVPCSIQFPPVNARYIRIVVENFGIIPQGAQGAGHPAWLFIDELVLE